MKILKLKEFIGKLSTNKLRLNTVTEKIERSCNECGYDQFEVMRDGHYCRQCGELQKDSEYSFD